MDDTIKEEHSKKKERVQKAAALRELVTFLKPVAKNLVPQNFLEGSPRHVKKHLAPETKNRSINSWNRCNPTWAVEHRILIFSARCKTWRAGELECKAFLDRSGVQSGTKIGENIKTRNKDILSSYSQSTTTPEHQNQQWRPPEKRRGSEEVNDFHCLGFRIEIRQKIITE